MSEPLSLRFANTRYAVRGQAHDGIGTRELLHAWLTRHADELGLTGAPRIGRTDVPAFVDLRDAVRDLIAVAVDGGRAPAHDDGVALLNRLSAGAPSWPTLVRADGRFQVVERATGDARASALAALARDAMTLLGGDLPGPLRACGAPGCVQFFIKDHPRREWCSPTCGNRVRAARHYLRHREVR
ncbi:CGNR zinc finger domain-containing protein [Virgisporangium aurantiacum]|uniref:CGNR zinc finger domain-containing protein n=1 Tax=Virgisporangium aurantiacum TaxID=175570 RepID=UPI0019509EAF|nr:CGNR zinc finger domain-containing protein [Virgisporangium aurantiacum]